VIGNVNSVDPDFAVAFHPTAFALANVAPVVPDGATTGATLTFEGSRCGGSGTTIPTTCPTGRSTPRSPARRPSRTAATRTTFELTDENVRAVEIQFTQES
jgi:hypothetical protein